MNNNRANACLGGSTDDRGDDETTDGWVHAVTICTSMGARLCTAAELQSDETRCTGCMHDAEQVWSGDTCDGGHLTAAGGSHLSQDACPDVCSTADCVCPLQCHSDFESHAVRCCGDVLGADCPNSTPMANPKCSGLTCDELAGLYGEWPIDNGCTDRDSTEVCAESDAGMCVRRFRPFPQTFLALKFLGKLYDQIKLYLSNFNHLRLLQICALCLLV